MSVTQYEVIQEAGSGDRLVVTTATEEDAVDRARDTSLLDHVEDVVAVVAVHDDGQRVYVPAGRFRNGFPVP